MGCTRIENAFTARAEKGRRQLQAVTLSDYSPSGNRLLIEPLRQHYSPSYSKSHDNMYDIDTGKLITINEY